MNFRTPIGQVAFLVLLSCIIGFGSNLVRADKIPWIAVELATAESIDKDVETGESVLVAISLEQAKNLLNKTFFLWMPEMRDTMTQVIFRAH